MSPDYAMLHCGGQKLLTQSSSYADKLGIAARNARTFRVARRFGGQRTPLFHLQVLALIASGGHNARPQP
jgi:hypothetical protein